MLKINNIELEFEHIIYALKFQCVLGGDTNENGLGFRNVMIYYLKYQI